MSLPHLNYRHAARELLSRAKAELETNDPRRVRYAALELRDAMEALTYDRARAFKDDIPPKDYEAWQPRKLMAALLSFDPTIEMTSSISYAAQDGPGEPAPRNRMKSLGADIPFTLSDLREHYDALGSFLHVPTLRQVNQEMSQTRNVAGSVASNWCNHREGAFLARLERQLRAHRDAARMQERGMPTANHKASPKEQDHLRGSVLRLRSRRGHLGAGGRAADLEARLRSASNARLTVAGAPSIYGATK